MLMIVHAIGMNHLQISHSLCYYSQLVSSYYIKASRTLKKSSLKDYKIIKDNNNLLLSKGSVVQLLTGNNREERKTTSQAGVEITILR